MNCDEFLSLIDSMLDGELSVETTARVNGHADHCKTCGPERDRLIDLRERMQELQNNIVMPEELESQIKARLAKQVKQSAQATQNTASGSKSQLHKKRWLASSVSLATAAAVLCLLAVGYYFFTFSNSAVKTTLTQHATAPSIVASDLAEHTLKHLVSDFQYSPQQLPQLRKQTGFEIKPPTIPQWRLASICVCSIGKDGLPVAHMTYLGTGKNNAKKILTCYQVIAGSFDKSGLSESKRSGIKPVWTTKIHDLAIALVQGHGTEIILVGAMSIKDLNSITL